MPHYTQRFVLLGASTSSTTNETFPVFVGDFRQLALSIESSTGSASRYTLYGSLENGFNASLRAASFSAVTAVTAAGDYTLDPGLRWVYAQRDTISVSASSNATITLAGTVTG